MKKPSKPGVGMDNRARDKAVRDWVMSDSGLQCCNGLTSKGECIAITFSAGIDAALAHVRRQQKGKRDGATEK